MSAVIHTLWEREDKGLMILPASVPVDAPAVQSELTRYLPPVWDPIIEKDIDGPNSLPLKIDRENPMLGRYSAARRVARTLYLGSAPTQDATKKGLAAVVPSRPRICETRVRDLEQPRQSEDRR